MKFAVNDNDKQVLISHLSMTNKNSKLKEVVVDQCLSHPVSELLDLLIAWIFELLDLV